MEQTLTYLIMLYNIAVTYTPEYEKNISDNSQEDKIQYVEYNYLTALNLLSKKQDQKRLQELWYAYYFENNYIYSDNIEYEIVHNYIDKKYICDNNIESLADTYSTELYHRKNPAPTRKILHGLTLGNTPYYKDGENQKGDLVTIDEINKEFADNIKDQYDKMLSHIVATDLFYSAVKDIIESDGQNTIIINDIASLFEAYEAQYDDMFQRLASEQMSNPTEKPNEALAAQILTP